MFYDQVIGIVEKRNIDGFLFHHPVQFRQGLCLGFQVDFRKGFDPLEDFGRLDAEVVQNAVLFIKLVQKIVGCRIIGQSFHDEAVGLGFGGIQEIFPGRHGFYFNVGNGSINDGVHGGSRTIPGQFGALASKLMDYLDEDHYGVKLTPQDRHRLTLWLDSNSEFYGSYENTEAQARGEIVWPTLD